MSPVNLLHDRHLDSSEIERRLVLALLDAETVDLEGLTAAILDLHPERADWVALVNRLWQAESRGGASAVRQELVERSAELVTGRLEVADRVIEALGPRRVILTLSKQPSVIAALAASAGRRRVILGEGRPLREGVTAARDLAAVGVDVTVVSDAVLLGLPLHAAELPPPLFFEPADAVVLIGANALLADGFIAKSGCRALSEVAAIAGLEVLVAAGLSRLLPATLARRFTPPAADPVDMGAPAVVHPVHQPCEFVPWRLATRVAVSKEILDPAEIAPLASALSVAPELASRWRARF